MWAIETPALSPAVRSLGELGQNIEREGWDGICFVDSQNLCPEAYVALSTVAAATSRLRLGIAVTNAVTRHPALAASAATTINRVSGGRMILSIGRGDSANAHIGLAPLGVAEFERYVDALKRYLHGESISMEEAATFAIGNAKSSVTLGLADAPESSALGWMSDSEIVPLEVAGAGPRVLDLGARYADRVMVSVGAVPERVSWAVNLVREARRVLDGGGKASIGAYVTVVANDDPKLARDCMRPGLAATSRFSVMHGAISGPVDAASAEVLGKIRSSYNMKEHGSAHADHSDVVDDVFTDKYGIAGSPEYCIRRLKELCDLGIDKFTIFGLATGTDAAVVERHRTLMAEEVIPAITSYAAVESPT